MTGQTSAGTSEPLHNVRPIGTTAKMPEPKRRSASFVTFFNSPANRYDPYWKVSGRSFSRSIRTPAKSFALARRRLRTAADLER